MAEADGSASSSDASPEAPPAGRGDDGRGEGELGRVRSGPSHFATTLDAADAAVRARSSCFFSRRTRCFAARRAAREEEPPPATRGGLAAVPSRRATMYVRTDACDGSCAARQACATRFVGKLGRDCTLLSLCASETGVPVARCPFSSPEPSSAPRGHHTGGRRARRWATPPPPEPPRLGAGWRTPPPSCSVRDERTRRPGRLAADDDLSAAAASRLPRRSRPPRSP